jgi:hypothetical protein
MIFPPFHLFDLSFHLPVAVRNGFRSLEVRIVVHSSISRLAPTLFLILELENSTSLLAVSFAAMKLYSLFLTALFVLFRKSRLFRLSQIRSKYYEGLSNYLISPCCFFFF